jgi:hypothetical protein
MTTSRERVTVRSLWILGCVVLGILAFWQPRARTQNMVTPGAMMTWLQNDLSQTTQDWIIAYWHHPPYSKGSHDSDTENQLIEMRQNANPITHGLI